MKNYLETLEFHRIQENLVALAHYDAAKRQIFSLQLINDFEILDFELLYLEEARLYQLNYNNFVFTLLPELELEFSKLKKGSSASLELLSNLIGLLNDATYNKENFVDSEDFPKLSDLISKLTPFSELVNDLKRSILPDLTISDEASFLLKDLRKKLAVIEANQKKFAEGLVIKYSKYLTSQQVVYKDSEYVLPVSSSFKNYVKGIAIDKSDTDKTIFIEPYEILEYNNKRSEVIVAIDKEIKRIIDEFTRRIMRDYDSIYENYQTMVRLDFLFTKASFGGSYDGMVATLTKERKITLRGLKHLFIPKAICIQNTVVLGGENPNILLISGPNAGGKSVFLKAVAMAVMLNQMGLMVPTLDEAVLPIFDQIFVDSGDQQSVLENLSTFSSHMLILKEILEEATSTSLIIIDELGTGTSPLDGESLGIGSLELIKQLNALSIITSHYEGLKKLSINDERILTGAMIFDTDNLKPTYKLRLGVVGKSYGIEVAERLGLPTQLIKKAKEYLSLNQSKESELAEKLALLIEEAEEEKERLEVEIKEAKIKNSEIDLERERLRKIREKKSAKIDQEVQKIVEHKLETINSLMDELKIKHSLPTINRIKGAIRTSGEKKVAESEPISTDSFSVGDRVRVIKSNELGIVTQVSGNRVQISASGLLYIMKKADLIHDLIFNPKEKKAPSHPIDNIIMTRRVPLELNIIGKHVDEGLEEVGAYLDSCLLAHYHEVRIVHGSGTGVLRSAVHEFLRKSKLVKEFRLGGGGEGGVGATVVSLK